jgi:hypothetical protein
LSKVPTVTEPTGAKRHVDCSYLVLLYQCFVVDPAFPSHTHSTAVAFYFLYSQEKGEKHAFPAGFKETRQALLFFP